MKLRQLHTALLILASITLVACSDDMSIPSDPHNGKTPIELSVGGTDAPSLTRAVITDGTDKEMKTFDVDSKIFMIIKSKYKTFESPYEYLNYGGSKADKYTVTRGEVAANSNDVVFTDANGKCIRYWDDAHARSSQLTIWAYAQKGQNWYNCTFEVPNSEGTGIDAYKSQEYTPNENYKLWDESKVYPAIRYWRASHHASDDNQDETSVQCQDLLFCNNIADYTSASGSDRRLSFDPVSKHFPSKTDEWETNVKKTEMKFYHAMSKITIHIKKGSGFATGSFDFTGSGNIALSGFNKKGLFHIEDGQFEYIWKHKPNTTTDEETEADAFKIPQIYRRQTPASGDAMTLEALVIPNVHGNVTGLTDTHSRFVPSSTDVMMEFTINNNKYQITSGQLYDALHVGGNPANALVANATEKSNNGTYIPMEAGKNYVFTFTVSKTQIGGLTAQVVPWETVTASNINPSNAQITLQLEDRGSAISNDVNVYRSAETASTITTDITTENGKGYVWDNGYGDANLYDYDNATSKLQTSWYWPDNQTFYHFRAVAPTSLVKKTANNKDYVELSALENTSSNSTPSYTDVTWGAPFKDIDASAKLSYSASTGFDATSAHQIHPAIGTTESTIKLIMFHMMSDVTIKVQSVTGDAAVQLGNGSVGNCTTIKFEKIYKSGTVRLGDGLVTGVYEQGESSKGNHIFTTHPAPADGVITWEHYGAIPQDLAGPTAAATDDVILVITTPDKNEYRVSMKDVKATVVTETNIQNPYNKVGGTGEDKDKYIINRWYPGFKYTYTFKLSKKKIESITATILDWETVTAGDDNVQIK